MATIPLLSLLAQLPDGMYVNPWKLAVMACLFTCWAVFAQWVDKDALAVNTFRVLWNIITLATGVVGMLLMLFVPHFLLGILLFLVVDGGATAFKEIGRENFEIERTMTVGKALSIERDGDTLAAWPLDVVADVAPSIAFHETPSPSARDALRLSYDARDDSGLVSVEARLRRAEGCPEARHPWPGPVRHSTRTRARDHARRARPTIGPHRRPLHRRRIELRCACESAGYWPGLQIQAPPK